MTVGYGENNIKTPVEVALNSKNVLKESD